MQSAKHMIAPSPAASAKGNPGREWYALCRRSLVESFGLLPQQLRQPVDDKGEICVVFGRSWRQVSIEEDKSSSLL